MSFTALILIITGAICHALWNYFAKLASGGKLFVWLYGVVSAILLLPLLILTVAVTNINVLSNWPILLCAALGSAVLHIFYSLSLQHGYQNADMSVVYPVARGAGPLFAVLGAIFLLSERPSMIGWLGLSIIFIGILSLLGIRNLLRKHNDLRLKKGLRWGVLTGLLIASYTLLDGWVVKVAGLPVLMFYVSCLWIRAFMLAPFVLKDMPALKEQWKINRRYILLVGVLSPTAYLLTLYAMTMAPLSYVAPARELSMLFGAFIASYLLREKGAKSRLLATLCIAIGVGLLSFA